MSRPLSLDSLDEGALEERFVRASGPGGQHVNKVATAVELRFHIRRSSLPPDVQGRLIALAGSRVIAGDVLLIDSREHRTQAQNRETARTRLLALLKQAARRPRTRKATTPTRASRERRLETKKRRSAVKAGRGRGPADAE
ncbi:MAG: alternative ribosome rescue aminoacyl-tRNA hydrolase ArfB [Acidobacteriota bacterium]